MIREAVLSHQAAGHHPGAVDSEDLRPQPPAWTVAMEASSGDLHSGTFRGSTRLVPKHPGLPLIIALGRATLLGALHALIELWAQGKFPRSRSVGGVGFELVMVARAIL